MATELPINFAPINMNGRSILAVTSNLTKFAMSFGIQVP